MSWDVRPENWHLSMDDYPSALDLIQRFPDIELAWVDVADLRSALGQGWRRTSPAAAGHRYRSSRLVIHLEDGGSVSPPFVQPLRGQLEVNGGNHRIGWAIHVGELRMPVLLQRSHRAAAQRIMPSLEPV